MRFAARRARSSSSSTSCTRCWAQAAQRGPSTPATSSSRRCPRASSRPSAQRRPAEYRIIEKNAALERRFQPVMVDEPSVEDHDADAARAAPVLRGASPRALHRRGAGSSSAAVGALYHRPLPARQGHRPDRRSRLAAPSGADEPARPTCARWRRSSRSLQAAEEKAGQTQNYEQAAQIRAERIALEEEFNKAKARWQEERNLNDTVDEEQIASIVARWTGIPVTRMQERETEKLLHMEARLHERVDRPGRGHLGRLRRHPPQPLRPQRSAPAHRQLHLPGPHRRGQDRAGQDAGLVSVRRRRQPDPHRHERVRRAPLRCPA